VPQFSFRICGIMWWKRRLYVPREGVLCPPVVHVCAPRARPDSHLCLCAQARHFSSKEDSILQDGQARHFSSKEDSILQDGMHEGSDNVLQAGWRVDSFAPHSCRPTKIPRSSPQKKKKAIRLPGRGAGKSAYSTEQLAAVVRHVVLARGQFEATNLKVIIE
jgi:hypothetical protein